MIPIEDLRGFEGYVSCTSIILVESSEQKFALLSYVLKMDSNVIEFFTKMKGVVGKVCVFGFSNFIP